MRIRLSPQSIEDYRTFLKVKGLPRYAIRGEFAEFPDEYAGQLGIAQHRRPDAEYLPSDYLFDYQAAVSSLAIRKRKFAAFVRCGLGKTAIIHEFSRHAATQIGENQCALIVSPLMVVKQTMREAERFYGDTLPIERVPSSDLQEWLRNENGKIGITNYEALSDDLEPGRLGCLIADESSTMKSAYGKWGTTLIRIGRGLDWKLALTGTPAPNDRIEYANHAVFLDHYSNVNSFLARFFVNRGQTQNRWELKPHALDPFYRALSHWCIFLNNPATYGWKDNCDTIPPIKIHIDSIPMTEQQMRLIQDVTGHLIPGGNAGGIASRSTLSQIAKGHYKGADVETNKPVFIRRMVESWPDESTIIWCRHNAEQDAMARLFPDAANISGDTPQEKREILIEDFQLGRRKQLITKAKVMGFGMNLQIATRHVHNGLNDSWEDFHQCTARSNRVGSTKPLNVHIPITDCERPMVDNVLRKAKNIEKDIEEQERIFKEITLAIPELRTK